MSSGPIPMTRENYEKLKADVERMETVEMIAITKRIAAARAHGDLSENAEYHATREKLEMVQRRIYELEEQLSSPRFIEELPISGDSVSIGTKVTCLDLDTDEEVVYTILGPADTAPEQNIISFQSPLGRGLIGKVLDEEVSIIIPAGKRNFLILDIRRFDD